MLIKKTLTLSLVLSAVFAASGTAFAKNFWENTAVPENKKYQRTQQTRTLGAKQQAAVAAAPVVTPAPAAPTETAAAAAPAEDFRDADSLPPGTLQSTGTSADIYR